MFEVRVEDFATGMTYYYQMFSKLDVPRLAKELNTAYWAVAMTEPEKDDEEDAA
jgi:hypothetical protein